MAMKFAECNQFMFHNCSVRLHPLAVTTILDIYQRMEESQERAIGTLVGYVSEGNIVDVVDAFQVTFEEKNGQVLLGVEYHKRHFKLRQQVHTKEQVVGWFSVGGDSEINEHTCTIQQFYKSKDSMFVSSPTLPSPLYLQVDLAFEEDSARRIGWKVYTSQGTGNTAAVEDGAKATTSGHYDLMQFHPVALDASSYQQQKQVLNILGKTNGQCANELDTFGGGVKRLKGLLQDARKYVDLVQQGQVAEPDVEFGRELMKLLSLDNRKTAELRDGGMRDALMVQYLSTLARSEILLSEKITHLLAEGAEAGR